jgi:hypothetical protein
MRHARPSSATAMRLISAAEVELAARPMRASRIEVDLAPGWQMPRLVRGADASGGGGARFLRDRFQTVPTILRALAQLRSGTSLRSIAIACVLGMATGAAGACLLARLAPETAERMVVPVRYVASALGGTETMRPREAMTAMAPLPPLQPAAAGPSASSELGALLEKVRRELAQGKLEQPAGDNALASYRLLMARWPQEKGVRELGGAIGATFWSLGNDAKAVGDWPKALHYFEIVNSLPPLPASALPSGSSANERNAEHVAVTPR